MLQGGNPSQAWKCFDTLRLGQVRPPPLLLYWLCPIPRPPSLPLNPSKNAPRSLPRSPSPSHPPNSDGMRQNRLQRQRWPGLPPRHNLPVLLQMREMVVLMVVLEVRFVFCCRGGVFLKKERRRLLTSWLSCVGQSCFRRHTNPTYITLSSPLL